MLYYDIETSYTVGAVWGLYDQNVAHVLKEPYIISFAYKFEGEKDVKVVCIRDFPLYKKDKTDDTELLKVLHKLFSEAKIIVAHNGNSFDQKWVYGRFAVKGLPPPSPAQYIDTKLISQGKFRYNSNSLKSLGKYFGVGTKIDTGGIELWVDCIEHDLASAWEKMCKYNKQDVVLLEKVYKKLLPFITNHPNIALMNGDRCGCPNCGSTRVNKEGFAPTRSGIFQQWSCKDCLSWHRSPLKEGTQIR